MIKDLKYGWESLKLSWQANGVGSLLLLFSTIYENTLFPFVQVFLLAKLLDMLGSLQRITLINVSMLVGFYLSGSILKVLLVSYRDARESYQQIKTDSYVDMLINKKLTELDPATFEDPEFQSLIAQIEGVSGTLQAHLDRFTILIDAIVKFVTATIVVSAMFPLFAPLLLISSIPSFIAWSKFRKSTWPYYVEKRSFLTRITRYIKTLLSSDSTSKEAAIFHTGPTLLEKIKSEQKSYYSQFNKEINPRLLELVFGRFVQFCIFVYTQYLNLQSVLLGTLGIGQFTLVFQQTMNLASSAEEILNQYSSMSVRTKYLDKFYEFMNTKRLIQSPRSPVHFPELPMPAKIEFKKITFRYPGTTRDILHDFNLTIESGEKVAFVGENGAGKTTIIKLLLRFYDVNEGEILINGINIKEIDIDVWRKHVGALFQDFIKYQFTFQENIVFGNIQQEPNALRVEDAVKKSGAESILADLPNAYNQILGKMFHGGVDLSGGQWQKLALARAFYRDAPFLILDEPTSAIDAKAEYEIFQNVQKLEKDKTVIIISHRFSTVRNADRILVLDDGKIIEEGNHQTLIKKKGIYEELFNIQAQGYK